MKTVKALGTMVLALTLILGAVTPGLGAGTAAAPKNVIIMIADGTGFNGYLAGDYYLKGEAGKQIFEQKDWVKLACSTYSLGTADTSDDGNSYYDPNAVWQDFNTLSKNATDSSAAATAICTGVKTFDYALGVDQDKQPLTGLVSEFESRGKATGVVSSVPLSHATPGAFISHNPNRNDYDGISKEAIWQGPCEVILGAGNPDYDDAGKKLTAPKYAYIGEDTWLKLTSGNLTGADANGDGKADSWTFIQEKADFDSIAAGKKVPDRLLGVAQVGSALQNYRAGLGMPMTTPFETPFNANVPDLAAMSGAALNVLNKDKDGFFLMIEGGATDWANHSGKGVSFIEEYADFVKAIETVSAWVEKNSSWNDTLLIVTADHETGFITHTKGEYGAVGNNGKGIMPTMTYNVGGHSNQLVPFFSKGAGADAFQTFADQNDPTIAKYFGAAFGINGDYLDNTEISAAIRTMLGISVPDNKYPFKPTAAGYEVYAAPMTATALPSAQKVTRTGLTWLSMPITSTAATTLSCGIWRRCSAAAASSLK